MAVPLFKGQLYAHKIEWRDTEHEQAKQRLAVDGTTWDPAQPLLAGRPDTRPPAG